MEERSEITQLRKAFESLERVWAKRSSVGSVSYSVVTKTLRAVRDIVQARDQLMLTILAPHEIDALKQILDASKQPFAEADREILRVLIQVKETQLNSLLEQAEKNRKRKGKKPPRRRKKK